MRFTDDGNGGADPRNPQGKAHAQGTRSVPSAAEPPEGNPIEASPPRAALLPEGGVWVDAVPADTFRQKLVDAAGNLWFWGCQGL